MKKKGGGEALAWLFALMLICGISSLAIREGGEAALASMLAGANEAVTLALSLAGAYLLFMGIIGVATRAGLMESLSKRLAGVVRWLFPNSERASAAITLNLAANMLGMGNAATPFGLEAMRLMDGDDPHKGVATDGMCVLLAVNASALQLIPTGLIALRQAAGSRAPAEIVLPSLIASAAATLVAVVLCKLCCKR